MTGVLLDATGRPVQKALTIHVPKGYEDVEGPALVGKCLVPGCGATFFEGEEQAWQRHVGKCARANLDRLEAAASVPRMIAEDYDPEVTKHLRGVGERMIKEGRLEVKPREGAGFS